MRQDYDFTSFANTPGQQLTPNSQAQIRQQYHQSGIHRSSSSEELSQPTSSKHNNQWRISNQQTSQQNVSIPDLKREMEEALRPNKNSIFTNPNFEPPHNPKNRRSKDSTKKMSKSKSKQRHSKISRSKIQQSSNAILKNSHFGKYPFDVSIMKSDISMISTELNFQDMPKNLLDLEFVVTDDILTLRQEKLTLMEEYNKALENRYRVERQLNKIKKGHQIQEEELNNVLRSQRQSIAVMSSSPNAPGLIQEKMGVDPMIMKNQKLRGQYQQMLSKGQNQQINNNDERIKEQIAYLCSCSDSMQRELQDLEETSRRQHEQRFQTFFPNSKTNTPNSPNKDKSRQSSQKIMEIQRLRKIRQELLYRLGNRSHNQQMKGYFFELVEDNKKLQEKADELLLIKNSYQYESNPSNSELTKLESLREKIRAEQREKQLFFEDLKRFKAEMNSLKAQNEQLRSSL